MQCLQKNLVPEATGSGAGVTCDSIEKRAFGSHAGCYLESGVCKLEPKDWLAIAGIVEFKTFFESRDSFLALLQVAKECLQL